jgi:hypothetical protein
LKTFNISSDKSYPTISTQDIDTYLYAGIIYILGILQQQHMNFAVLGCFILFQISAFAVYGLSNGTAFLFT